MKGNLLCLVLGCLLTASSSSSKFVFTTDNRYPEHIVNDIRVQCPNEGSFPHPADCSWFYRCVDKAGVGFFQVFFFECEPGTIFHDPLDQCVYGSKDLCSPVIPPTTPVPTPPPTTTPTLSPDGTPPPSPTTFPTPSTETTPNVPSPPTPIPAKPETTSTTAAPVSTPLPPSPPPLSSTTPSPPVTSRTDCLNCISRPICQIGRQPYLAKVCTSCRFGGGDYIRAQLECGHKADPYFTDEGRCISGNDFCPGLRQEEQSNQVKDDLQQPHLIQCSDFKVRPDDPKIRDLFCRQYDYCSHIGVYMRTQRLCSSYFQCHKNQNGQWSVGIQNCNVRNLYSYDLDQCVPEPRASDLC